MNCKWYQRWLVASADDELRGWRAALLARHTAKCARCAADLKELRQIRDLVAAQKAVYASKLNDEMFWQKLRANMQSTPDEAPDGNLVFAYSSRSNGDAPSLDEVGPRGLTVFGIFPTQRMAVAAATAALLLVALVGFWLIWAPGRGGQLAAELPLLPPPGQNHVRFNDVQHAKNVLAREVRFDEPGVDIPVIMVTGMAPVEKGTGS
ncbi:MAG: zf-HC2 domain-containing protein [Verrucomicrobiae bacterium]|nr:zf-HC2 domain-containing protein [Verrucomicrobiae bacterium]